MNPFATLPPGVRSREHAKAWLSDAVEIWRYDAPPVTERRWRKPDGSIWAEVEIDLEAPYGDYRLTKLC